MESRKQAEAINTIVNNVAPIGIAKLKEKLGHKPLEVIMGMFLGTIVSLVYIYIIF